MIKKLYRFFYNLEIRLFYGKDPHLAYEYLLFMKTISLIDLIIKVSYNYDNLILFRIGISLKG